MSGRGAQGERVRSAEEPLERESELAEIRRAIAHAREGRGALLAIEGPSGIGKSRLLASAAALARRDDMELLLARAGELEGEYPFGVVLRLFEAQLHRADADEQRRLLRGRAMLAAPLLDAGSVDARPPATGDEFALIHGLYWCLVNLAERGSTVLLVDDVQWADDLSLRFLNYAAQRLDDLPVALLFAIRTGDPGAESALATRLAMQSQRSLRPVELSLDAVRQMLAASEVPAVRQEEFVQASWETTGGNPFLVQELLATIRQEPDRWSRADPASVQTFAPQSVGRNVILRLESLGPDAIAFARACAILGDAPLTSVGRLSGLDLGDAAAAAERLTKAQVLAAVDHRRLPTRCSVPRSTARSRPRRARALTPRRRSCFTTRAPDRTKSLVTSWSAFPSTMRGRSGPCTTAPRQPRARERPARRCAICAERSVCRRRRSATRRC